ncbi:hypothetical protein [Escherichia coli]|nr:hypothetical protein [Escherichia coli]
MAIQTKFTIGRFYWR